MDKRFMPLVLSSGVRVGLTPIFPNGPGITNMMDGGPTRDYSIVTTRDWYGPDGSLREYDDIVYHDTYHADIAADSELTGWCTL